MHDLGAFESLNLDGGGIFSKVKDMVKKAEDKTIRDAETTNKTPCHFPNVLSDAAWSMLMKKADGEYDISNVYDVLWLNVSDFTLFYKDTYRSIPNPIREYANVYGLDTITMFNRLNYKTFNPYDFQVENNLLQAYPTNVIIKSVTESDPTIVSKCKEILLCEERRLWLLYMFIWPFLAVLTHDQLTIKDEVDFPIMIFEVLWDALIKLKRESRIANPSHEVLRNKLMKIRALNHKGDEITGYGAVVDLLWICAQMYQPSKGSPWKASKEACKVIDVSKILDMQRSWIMKATDSLTVAALKKLRHKVLQDAVICKKQLQIQKLTKDMDPNVSILAEYFTRYIMKSNLWLDDYYVKPDDTTINYEVVANVRKPVFVNHQPMSNSCDLDRETCNDATDCFMFIPSYTDDYAVMNNNRRSSAIRYRKNIMYRVPKICYTALATNQIDRSFIDVAVDRFFEKPILTSLNFVNSRLSAHTKFLEACYNYEYPNLLTHLPLTDYDLIDVTLALEDMATQDKKDTMNHYTATSVALEKYAKECMASMRMVASDAFCIAIRELIKHHFNMFVQDKSESATPVDILETYKLINREIDIDTLKKYTECTDGHGKECKAVADYIALVTDLPCFLTKDEWTAFQEERTRGEKLFGSKAHESVRNFVTDQKIHLITRDMFYGNFSSIATPSPKWDENTTLASKLKTTALHNSSAPIELKTRTAVKHINYILSGDNLNDGEYLAFDDLMKDAIKGVRRIIHLESKDANPIVGIHHMMTAVRELVSNGKIKSITEFYNPPPLDITTAVDAVMTYTIDQPEKLTTAYKALRMKGTGSQTLDGVLKALEQHRYDGNVQDLAQNINTCTTSGTSSDEVNDTIGLSDLYQKRIEFIKAANIAQAQVLVKMVDCKVVSIARAALDQLGALIKGATIDDVAIIEALMNGDNKQVAAMAADRMDMLQSEVFYEDFIGTHEDFYNKALWKKLEKADGESNIIIVALKDQPVRSWQKILRANQKIKDESFDIVIKLLTDTTAFKNPEAFWTQLLIDEGAPPKETISSALAKLAEAKVTDEATKDKYLKNVKISWDDFISQDIEVKKHVSEKLNVLQIPGISTFHEIGYKVVGPTSIDSSQSQALKAVCHDDLFEELNIFIPLNLAVLQKFKDGVTNVISEYINSSVHIQHKPSILVSHIHENSSIALKHLTNVVSTTNYLELFASIAVDMKDGSNALAEFYNSLDNNKDKDVKEQYDVVQAALNNLINKVEAITLNDIYTCIFTDLSVSEKIIEGIPDVSVTLTANDFKEDSYEKLLARCVSPKETRVTQGNNQLRKQVSNPEDVSKAIELLDMVKQLPSDRKGDTSTAFDGIVAAVLKLYHKQHPIFFDEHTTGIFSTVIADKETSIDVVNTDNLAAAFKGEVAFFDDKVKQTELFDFIVKDKHPTAINAVSSLGTHDKLAVLEAFVSSLYDIWKQSDYAPFFMKAHTLLFKRDIESTTIKVVMDKYSKFAEAESSDVVHFVQNKDNIYALPNWLFEKYEDNDKIGVAKKFDGVWCEPFVVSVHNLSANKVVADTPLLVHTNADVWKQDAHVKEIIVTLKAVVPISGPVVIDNIFMNNLIEVVRPIQENAKLFDDHDHLLPAYENLIASLDIKSIKQEGERITKLLKAEIDAKAEAARIAELDAQRRAAEAAARRKTGTSLVESAEALMHELSLKIQSVPQATDVIMIQKLESDILDLKAKLQAIGAKFDAFMLSIPDNEHDEYVGVKTKIEDILKKAEAALNDLSKKRDKHTQLANLIQTAKAQVVVTQDKRDAAEKQRNIVIGDRDKIKNASLSVAQATFKDLKAAVALATEAASDAEKASEIVKEASQSVNAFGDPEFKTKVDELKNLAGDAATQATLARAAANEAKEALNFVANIILKLEEKEQQEEEERQKLFPSLVSALDKDKLQQFKQNVYHNGDPSTEGLISKTLEHPEYLLNPNGKPLDKFKVLNGDLVISLLKSISSSFEGKFTEDKPPLYQQLHKTKTGSWQMKSKDLPVSLAIVQLLLRLYIRLLEHSLKQTNQKQNLQQVEQTQLDEFEMLLSEYKTLLPKSATIRELNVARNVLISLYNHMQNEFTTILTNSALKDTFNKFIKVLTLIVKSYKRQMNTLEFIPEQPEATTKNTSRKKTSGGKPKCPLLL